VLAFPSLYEGFGLPLLEAMGHGLPAIASVSSALTEIADPTASSGNAPVAPTTAGSPCPIASRRGSPKPSYRLGNASTDADAYSAASVGSSTWPRYRTPGSAAMRCSVSPYAHPARPAMTSWGTPGRPLM